MSNAQPCMILDDDELERVGRSRTVREWRRAPEDIGAAIRGFRSEEGGAAAPPPRQFPTAFQTYKPEKGGGVVTGGKAGFPFQQTTPPLQGRKPSAAASPDAPSAGAAPRGTLFQAVRRVFYNSEKGESAPAVPPPLVLNESEPEDYPYAQCTPPAQEAPPPGYSPKTPPWWPEAGTAENVPLIQENGRAGGNSS